MSELFNYQEYRDRLARITKKNEEYSKSGDATLYWAKKDGRYDFAKKKKIDLGKQTPKNIEERENEAHNFYKELRSYFDGETRITDLYLQKHFPDRSNFTEEEQQDALKKLEVAAKIARKKLDHLQLLWTFEYGNRFFHHSMSVHWQNVSHKFSNEGEAKEQLQDIAKSYVNNGITRSIDRDQSLRDEYIEEYGSMERAEEKAPHDENFYTFMRDDKQSTYREVTDNFEQPITFIIDKGIEKEHWVDSQHASGEGKEYIVKSSIAPKYILAAYTPSHPRIDKDSSGIGYAFGALYDDLILEMMDNPNNAFPIISGMHPHRAFEGTYKNTYENSKVLADPNRTLFGR